MTRVEPETAINPANEELLKNWEETRERFLRWKVGVDKAVSAPENREMMAEIRKKNLRLYYSANLLEGTPDPTKFGFRDAQDAGNADRIYNMLYAYYRHYADLPHRDQGTYLKLTHPTGAGITRIDVNPPGEMPPGTYVMRIRAGAVEGTPASRRFVEIGHRPQDHNRMKGLEGLPISSHQVTGTLQHPEILETYLNVTAKDSAKTRRGFAIQERHPTDRKQYFLDNFYTLKESNGYGFEPAIWIDWIELEGPLESAAMAESKVTLSSRKQPSIRQTNKRSCRSKTPIHVSFNGKRGWMQPPRPPRIRRRSPRSARQNPRSITRSTFTGSPTF